MLLIGLHSSFTVIKRKTDVVVSGLQDLQIDFSTHRSGVKTPACFHLFNIGVILK